MPQRESTQESRANFVALVDYIEVLKVRLIGANRLTTLISDRDEYDEINRCSMILIPLFFIAGIINEVVGTTQAIQERH